MWTFHLWELILAAAAQHIPYCPRRTRCTRCSADATGQQKSCSSRTRSSLLHTPFPPRWTGMFRRGCRHSIPAQCACSTEQPSSPRTPLADPLRTVSERPASPSAGTGSASCKVLAIAIPLCNNLSGALRSHQKAGWPSAAANRWHKCSYSS